MRKNKEVLSRALTSLSSCDSTNRSRDVLGNTPGGIPKIFLLASPEGLPLPSKYKSGIALRAL